jgi:hypothetical protein
VDDSDRLGCDGPVPIACPAYNLKSQRLPRPGTSNLNLSKPEPDSERSRFRVLCAGPGAVGACRHI